MMDGLIHFIYYELYHLNQIVNIYFIYLKMSSYYKNRNRKEPQIKIGSKYENVEYSSKNIDPNMNYLNRQLYEEESLKKARQKRQLEEYSYYAKALENSRPPSEKFHSKVNYDNLTGKIGQEKMEEEFRKYQQSKSRVDSNAFAKPPAQDMRSMNYHGYNIINNNILGFCDPNQKFPATSYQQTYQGKPLQKELNNLTPSQYEDYQAFRREELERMKRTQQPPVNSNQPQMEMKEDPKTQAMKNELQREREYLEKQRALEVEQRKMNEMQRNYQSQDAYMKMRQEVEQKPNENPYDKMTQEDYERYMQMQAMQNNNSKPNQIPPQSEPIDTKPQLPNQNEDPNQQGPKVDDELYRKAYEQYLLEQQQKENPNTQPPKEEIPPKEPINQPNDNIPQGGVEPNNKEYMEYMNKKAQEEMEQREYLARMTPKQREQYEKEMYLREQEYYRQMQNAPREQNMMPNQPSNEDYEREQYLKYLQEKQMAENKPQPSMSEQERREREEYERYLQSQAIQNQQPSNGQQTLSPEDEARAREEYEQYMRAQEMQRGGNPQYFQEQEQYLKAKQMAEEEYRAKEEKERQEYMEYLKQQNQTVPKDQPQPINDEREKYLEYLKSQSQNPQQQLPPSNINEPPKENNDPEYLKKLKQYEEIVQGNESNSDINRIPSAQRRQYDMSQLPPQQRTPYDNYPSSQRTPGQNPPMNYHMARQHAIQAATPGKITKSNYIPSNPYSEKKYNLGKSNLSTNPITNPINSYKFDYNRLNNPLINTGRLANAGSNIINK